MKFIPTDLFCLNNEIRRFIEIMNNLNFTYKYFANIKLRFLIAINDKYEKIIKTNKKFEIHLLDD